MLTSSSVAGVRIWSWLDYKERLPGFLKRATLGLVLIKPVINTYVTSPPTKLFHCMVAGLPVIAGDTPGIRPIVMKENCGVLVDAASAEQVSLEIAKLLKDEKMRKLMEKTADEQQKENTTGRWSLRSFLALYRSLGSGDKHLSENRTNS